MSKATHEPFARQISPTSPNDSAQVYDLFSAGVRELTLKITNLPHFHILNVKNSISNFLFKWIWGTFQVSLQTMFVLPLKRHKLASAVGRWLEAMLYYRKDCFNAHRMMFQTSRVPLPQKPGVRRICHTQKTKVCGWYRKIQRSITCSKLVLSASFLFRSQNYGVFFALCLGV